MKNSYQISYRFRNDAQLPYPHPSELEAEIEINGEPRKYFVRWTKNNRFSPTGGVPNKEAANQAVSRLTQWYNEWFNAPDKQVKIAHENYYWGNDVYVAAIKTVVQWKGLTWDSENSQAYVNEGFSKHASQDTQFHETYESVPDDAIVINHGLEETLEEELESIKWMEETHNGGGFLI